MGHECLVRPSLTRGDLVVPFEALVRTGASLVLETARFGQPSPACRAVISWLSGG